MKTLCINHIHSTSVSPRAQERAQHEGIVNLRIGPLWREAQSGHGAVKLLTSLLQSLSQVKVKEVDCRLLKNFPVQFLSSCR